MGLGAANGIVWGSAGRLCCRDTLLAPVLLAAHHGFLQQSCSLGGITARSSSFPGAHIGILYCWILRISCCPILPACLGPCGWWPCPRAHWLTLPTSQFGVTREGTPSPSPGHLQGCQTGQVPVHTQWYSTCYQLPDTEQPSNCYRLGLITQLPGFFFLWCLFLCYVFFFSLIWSVIHPSCNVLTGIRGHCGRQC